MTASTHAIDILCQEADALRQLATQIKDAPQAVEAFVDQVLALNGKVVLTGIGKSGLIAAKIAATLASTGTPAQFMHTGDAGHGDLGMVSPNDMILALSNSGQSRELLPIIAYARKLNIPLVAMTSGLESPLGLAASLILPIPAIDEACPLGLAPMTSTTMQLALGDALAGALIKARGFTREDFAIRHMGGSLGLRTKTIADYFAEIAPLPAVPMVASDAALGEVVKTISSGRKGGTLVQGQACEFGIITEGDVARAIGEGSLALTASDLVTWNPVTVDEGELLTEALNALRTRKVNVIVVSRADQMPRLVHIQDLLELGL